MNITRVITRSVVAFAVLYLLGYIVPGFSGLTFTLLTVVSILVGVAAALVERTTHPRSKRGRALALFLISAAVVYFFSWVAVGRPPVVSTLIAAGLVAMVDMLYPAEGRKLEAGPRSTSDE